jgi:hypothetical protein
MNITFLGKGSDGFVIRPPLPCLNVKLNEKYSKYPIMKIQNNIHKDPKRVAILRKLYQIDKSNDYFIYEISGGEIDKILLDSFQIYDLPKIKNPYGYFMADGGKYNLSEYFTKYPIMLSTFNVIHILEKIMNNIKLLQSHKIVHYDLKFPNIMVSHELFSGLTDDLSPDIDISSDDLLEQEPSTSHPPTINPLETSFMNIKFIDFSLSFLFTDYKTNFLPYDLSNSPNANMAYPVHPPFINILDEEILRCIYLTKPEMKDRYRTIHEKYYKNILLNGSDVSYDEIFDEIYDDTLSIDTIHKYMDKISNYIDKIDIFSIGISFLWMYEVHSSYVSQPIMSLLHHMTDIQPEKQYNAEQVHAELVKLKEIYKLYG